MLRFGEIYIEKHKFCILIELIDIYDFNIMWIYKMFWKNITKIIYVSGKTRGYI